MTKPRLFGVARHDGKIVRMQRLSEGRTYEECLAEVQKTNEHNMQAARLANAKPYLWSLVFIEDDNIADMIDFLFKDFDSANASERIKAQISEMSDILEEYKTELGTLYFMVNDLTKANKPQNQELVLE